MISTDFYFKHNSSKSFYYYLEDGIQYQMDIKFWVKLKDFLGRHCNVKRLPINSWYKQLTREDKNQVIVAINKSHTIKM
jgi:hypothetical protein